MYIILKPSEVAQNVFGYDPIKPNIKFITNNNDIRNKIKDYFYAQDQKTADIRIINEERDYLLSARVFSLYGTDVFIVGKAQKILQLGSPHSKTLVLEVLDLMSYNSTDFEDGIPKYYLPIILCYQFLYNKDLFLYIKYKDQKEIMKVFTYDVKKIAEMIDEIKLYVLREYNNICFL